MQKYLEGLTALHTWELSAFREVLGLRGDDALVGAIKAFKPVVHPVVRKNPDSGRKCIFVNADFTRHIQGVDRQEARGILNFLLEWLKKPEFMVHHQWEPAALRCGTTAARSTTRWPTTGRTTASTSVSPSTCRVPLMRWGMSIRRCWRGES